MCCATPYSKEVRHFKEAETDFIRRVLRQLVGFRCGKKICQNSDCFGYCFIKNDILFIYFLCIYKKPIILSLFEIDTLNFTMHILTILICPLKTYVVRLHNLISMNIFFTLDHERSQVFFVIVKRKPISNFNEHRSSHHMCSVRKGVLRNFAKFSGKHLCQSFFFHKVVTTIDQLK